MQYIKIWVIIQFFWLFACNDNLNHEEGGTTIKQQGKAGEKFVAPDTIAVEHDSLPVYRPGKASVQAPEKRKAGNGKETLYFAPKRIIPGKSDLPISQEEYEQGKRREKSKQPKVVTAGEPRVVSIMKKDENHPRDSDAQHASFHAADTLKPPPTYIVPGVSDNQDGIEAAKVMDGDTLVPPKRIAVKHPRPRKVLPFKYKNEANRNIKFLDVEVGLASAYVQSVFEDSHGNIWIGTSNGVSYYDGIRFVHYTTREGLSNNYVRDIHEDRNGNLWFSTWGGGVIKYDGQLFVIYTTRQGLSDNYVKSIHEDTEGNLWFGTGHGGINRFDGRSFTHYTVEQGLSGNYVLAIDEDADGNLWIGTYQNGVNKFDGKSFIHYTTKEGLSSNRILSVYPADDGPVWIGTDGGGLEKLTGNTITHYTTRQGLVHNIVRSIDKGKRGNLWIGTWGGGISKYDGEAFTNYTRRDGLSSNYVRSVFQDSQGNVWTGTEGGGLNLLQDIPFQHFTVHEGMIYDNIWSVYEANNGDIWLGSWGNGVSRFDGKTFVSFDAKEGLGNNFVRTITQGEDGDLWFGTRGGGINRYNGNTFTHYTIKQGLPDNDVYAVYKDSKGHIWVGTDGSGICRYNGTSFVDFTGELQLGNYRVYAIEEDEKHNLWFGIYGNGLLKYDGKQFLHYTTEQGLSSNQVTSLLHDHSGNLWIGTHGGGVNYFDGTSFGNYASTKGMDRNTVWSVVEDKDHNLWMTTERGIYMMPLETHVSAKKPDGGGEKPKFYKFGRQDGLKGLNFYSNGVCYDSRNCIWWGSNKSLTMLDLERFHLNSSSPRVQLNSVRVKQQFIDYSRLNEAQMSPAEMDRANVFHDSAKVKQETLEQIKKIRFDEVAKFYNYPVNPDLPPEIGHLSFHFSARDWKAPHKIQYRYMLEGLEDKWSRTTSTPMAVYRNIPYGSYTFKVQAIGRSGGWSKPFEYHFTILPPWWLAWWAKGIYGILGIAAILGIVKWRTASLKKRQKELEQQVQERTKEIKNQNKKLNSQNEEIQMQAEFLKRGNEKLNEKNSRLTEMNNEKNSMMRIVAHDLKTPLNSVFTYLKIVEEDGWRLSEEQVETITQIYNVLEDGNNLIRDLLDVNAIEEFQTKVNFSSINIDEYVRERVALHRKNAGEKGIKIHYSGSFRKRVVSMDMDYLQRILDNLISNAVKFSPFNSNVYVEFVVHEEKMVFSVKDEGPGFSQEDKKHVFKKFQKLSARPTNQEPSSGLGLSIVQTLVTRLNGNIELKSESGKGSEFIITLPLDQNGNL